MADVFISYSRRSERQVAELVSTLQTMGHTVWFDKHLSGASRKEGN